MHEIWMSDVFQMFMAYNSPEKITKGKDFEYTLIGSILALTCIPEFNKQTDFFNEPSSASKSELDITEKNLWQVSVWHTSQK